MLQAERDIKARLEVELSGSKIQSKMLSDMVSRASIAQEADDDDVRRTPDTERSKLLSLIHISEPTRLMCLSRMPSSA